MHRALSALIGLVAIVVACGGSQSSAPAAASDASIPDCPGCTGLVCPPRCTLGDTCRCPDACSQGEVLRCQPDGTWPNCSSACDMPPNTCEALGLRTPTNGSCPCGVIDHTFTGPCCPAYLVTDCLDGSTDGQISTETGGDGASPADATASSADASGSDDAAPEASSADSFTPDGVDDALGSEQ